MAFSLVCLSSVADCTLLQSCQDSIARIEDPFKEAQRTCEYKHTSTQLKQEQAHLGDLF